jgi:hypothetical protein
MKFVPSKIINKIYWQFIFSGCTDGQMGYGTRRMSYVYTYKCTSNLMPSQYNIYIFKTRDVQILVLITFQPVSKPPSGETLQYEQCME